MRNDVKLFTKSVLPCEGSWKGQMIIAENLLARQMDRPETRILRQPIRVH